MGDDAKPDTTDETAAPNKDEAKPTPPPPPHHEEALVTTSHELKVGRRKLAYTATAGRILLKEEEGEKKASFFFTAYTLDGADPERRPILFAFNGGPGSSSVWLHLGALGPKRVAMGDDDGMAPVPPGRLVDNPETLLDVTDLVFIDPVSTGYSRAIPEKEAEKYHHFKRDIESVGEFIRLYLTRFERWASPKFLGGESYGTTRSAGVAGHLLERHGITFNGLLLVSAILNFQTAGFDPKTWTFNRGNDLPYVVFLPTYTAIAWYHGKLDKKLQRTALPKLLDEVRTWAESEYTVALMRGDELPTAQRRAVAEQLATYTGLDVGYVERSDLRIEILRFCKELLRDRRRTVGRLDGRYVGIDRFATGDTLEHDPSLDAIMGPYTAMLNDYVRRELGYESDLPYEILTDRVRPWSYEDFQNAFVDVSETLRDTMSRNPFMKVIIANGYYDLATPFAATEYTVRHLGLDPELRPNVSLTYYEAGHMMYLHLPSLKQLNDDLRAFIGSALP